jgi:hypothetical protein
MIYGETRTSIAQCITMNVYTILVRAIVVGYIRNGQLLPKHGQNEFLKTISAVLMMGSIA